MRIDRDLQETPDRRLSRRSLLAGALAGAGALALPFRPALAGPPRRAAGTAGDVTAFALAVPDDALARSAAVVGAGGLRTSPALRAPRRFDLIGLRFTGATSAHLELRTRRRGGAWSRWVDAHPLGAHGPDSAPRSRTPRGTDPIWVGGADELQLRASRAVRGLRADLVRVERRPGPPPGAARGSQAASGPPPIVPRADWGAAAVPPRESPSYGEVDLAFVHHTATANDYGPGESASIVLAVAKYHRNSNGWNDVGYNFLVDQYGTIFEGRAGGVDAAVVGAQAQGYNSKSTGIALIGSFDGVAVPDAALDAVARLIAWKLGVHGVPTQGTVTVTSGGGPLNRYPYGRRITLNRISGHRDGDSTDCPGNALYRQLPELRRRAAGFPSRPVTRITAAAASSVVSYPEAARLRGRLALADGTSPAGAIVEVQRRGSRGYKTVQRVRAGGDGTWSAQVELSRSARFRAVVFGPNGRAVARSSAISVGVAPRLRAALTADRVRAGRAVRVRGSIRPKRGRVVLAIAKRKKGGGYRSVATRRVGVRGGRFETSLKLGPGLWRVIVSSPADARNAAAETDPVYARVLSPPKKRRRTRRTRSGGGGAPAGS